MTFSRNCLARLLGALIVVGIAAIGGAAPAAAHARLVDSYPAPGSALATMPAQIRLTFNEAVDLSFSTIELLDAAGEPRPTGEPAVDPEGAETLLVPAASEPVAAGVYTLVWRVLSAVDGHVTSGTVPFSVGTGEAPAGVEASNAGDRPPWWQVAPRWLELSGWVLVTGIVAFGAINFQVLGRLHPRLRREVVDRWRQAWFFGYTIALAGMVLGIWAQTLRVAGASSIAAPDIDSLADVLAETDYGRGWLVRLAIGVALLLLAGLAPRLLRRWQWALMAVLGVAALLTISRTGHAAGEGRLALAVAVDLVHFSAVSIWLGGLLALVLALRALGRSEDEETAGAAAMLTRNHSATSLAAMFAIVATGVVSASFHIGGYRSLREEDYGVTLLTKVALLLIVLVAAAINLLVLRPRTRIFLRASDFSGAWRQLRSIGHVATFEVGFAALILLASAILTVVAPADYPLTVQVAPRAVQVVEQRQAGDLDVSLTATLIGDPADQYRIAVAGSDGVPPEQMQRVIVESALAGSGDEESLGDRFDADPVEGSPGVYAFPATRLGLEGEWGLNVVIRRAGVEDVETAFTVDTSGTAPPAPRLVEDTWRLPMLTMQSWAFLALAAVMLVIGLAGLRRVTALEPVASGVLLAVCVLIAVGFAVSAARHAVPLSSGHDLENPVEDGDVTLRQGESLYAANCLRCHGADGRGAADAQAGHPQGDATDLTDSTVRKQSDGDLFTWISEGVPGTEMPAFDEALTEEERWALVTYVRALQEDAS
jgi:copper transport protein